MPRYKAAVVGSSLDGRVPATWVAKLCSSLSAAVTLATYLSHIAASEGYIDDMVSIVPVDVWHELEERFPESRLRTIDSQAVLYRSGIRYRAVSILANSMAQPTRAEADEAANASDAYWATFDAVTGGLE